MTYKLVAIDIDDTLLTDEWVITPRAKQAIQKARDKGVYVVLCTGRTKKGAQAYYDELNLDTLLISAGGAEVYDADENAIFTCPVDPTLVKEILNFGDDNKLHSQVYIDGELVYREKSKYTDFYESSYGHPGVVMPNLMEQEQIVTPKVLYIAEEDVILDVQQRAKKLFPTLSIKRSKPIYLEFSHPSSNKGTALEFTAKHYDVAREQIIAIGDSQIDAPMLEYAGLGVAVANAHPEIQKSADIVCASNQQDGVAEVIEKYILEE